MECRRTISGLRVPTHSPLTLPPNSNPIKCSFKHTPLMDSIVLKPFPRVSISIRRNPSFLNPSSSSSSKSKSLQISFKSSPINPKPNNHHLPSTSLFCLLLPALHSLRDFASFAIPNPSERCAPRSTRFDDSIGLPENGEYFRCGGIGMALFRTVPPLGKVGGGISPFVATLAANPTFVSGLLAWAFAQSMKMFLNFLVERKWDFRILFSSGGMPSSHSALCMALTTSVAFCHGAADSLFPVSLGFSLIVMYDAIGVRRHAGMHAEILNKIVEDLFQGHPISQRKLKVLLGHTPSQVIAGALLGILVACICCQDFMVAA